MLTVKMQPHVAVKEPVKMMVPVSVMLHILELIVQWQLQLQRQLQLQLQLQLKVLPLTTTTLAPGTCSIFAHM